MNKLFADDTSVFPVVLDKNISENELNNDLRILSNQVYQWKMSFKPDPLKQAQKVNFFMQKSLKTTHPTYIFNDSPVPQVASQRYFGMFLDCKLNFEEHLEIIFININKTIGLLCKFQNLLPRKSSLTIYESFYPTHFDYCDIIYD